MYEYQYAWANISDDLPQEYVFSAFWKEQQGSFLLWSFWHIVLAVVIMLRGGRWERRQPARRDPGGERLTGARRPPQPAGRRSGPGSGARARP